MSESTKETVKGGKKRWFSEPNVAIYALLVSILGINLGFFYHISSGIAANNALIVQVHLDLGKRIDATNERIDATNERIEGLQNLFTAINILQSQLPDYTKEQY